MITLSIMSNNAVHSKQSNLNLQIDPNLSIFSYDMHV